jgi:hypothetical protein
MTKRWSGTADIISDKNKAGGQMTVNQKEEAILLAMKTAGVDDTVVVALPKQKELKIHQGAEAEPAALRVKYDIITDAALVKRVVKKAEARILEVAKTFFFAPNSGIQVVEIATFEGDFVVPTSVTFSVQYEAGGLVLLTTPSKTVAVADVVQEEKKVALKKQVVSQPASKKPKWKKF